MELQKRITRIRKTIIAEVFYVKDNYEILIDSKEFNFYKSVLFGSEPTIKDYDNAKKWADNVILLQKLNSK